MRGEAPPEEEDGEDGEPVPDFRGRGGRRGGVAGGAAKDTVDQRQADQRRTAQLRMAAIEKMMRQHRQADPGPQPAAEAAPAPRPEPHSPPKRTPLQERFEEAEELHSSAVRGLFKMEERVARSVAIGEEGRTVFSPTKHDGPYVNVGMAETDAQLLHRFASISSEKLEHMRVRQQNRQHRTCALCDAGKVHYREQCALARALYLGSSDRSPAKFLSEGSVNPVEAKFKSPARLRGSAALERWAASVGEGEALGVQELLLGNKGLGRLFDLTKFCNLRRILLYGNELHEIDFAAVPARVEEMDLTNNRLERAVVSGKPDLRALRLSKNRLKEVRVEGAGVLQDLDVSSNPLASLEIAAAPHLKVLQASDVQGGGLVNFVPPAMPALEQLYLRHTQLEELALPPECTGTLRKLDVAENRLKRLPPELGGCHSLQYLWAFGNWLSEVPEFLGALEQLVYVDLRGNGLAAVPESLGKAPCLETLLLGQNRIAAFPASLMACRRLRVLDMSSNWLPSLPEDVLWKLTPLQRLILNDNCILIVPAKMAESNLADLQLKGNPLVKPLAKVLGYGLPHLKAYLKKHGGSPQPSFGDLEAQRALLEAKGAQGGGKDPGETTMTRDSFWV